MDYSMLFLELRAKKALNVACSLASALRVVGNHRPSNQSDEGVRQADTPRSELNQAGCFKLIK